MNAAQRELVARHVVERDPDLAPALPALVAAIRNAKRIRSRCGVIQWAEAERIPEPVSAGP